MRSFIMKVKLHMVHIALQRESWQILLGETISMSQWDSYQATTETTVLVTFYFVRA